MPGPKKLLWIDDDGGTSTQRFRYEQEVIEDEWGQVSWALNIQEATEKLATEIFDVLFLDQQLPFKSCEKLEQETWGGRLLLAWLFSNMELLNDAPEEIRTLASSISHSIQPNKQNRQAKIMSISAYEYIKIPFIRGIPVIVHTIKPIEIEELLVFLKTASA